MSDQSDFTVGVEQFDDGGEQFYDGGEQFYDGGEQFYDGGEQFYDDAHEQQYEQPYDDELAAADGRVAELEQQLAEREAEAFVAAHRELNDRAAALELVQVSARLAEALGAPELNDRPAVSARIHEARLQLDGDRGQEPRSTRLTRSSATAGRWAAARCRSEPRATRGARRVRAARSRHLRRRAGPEHPRRDACHLVTSTMPYRERWIVGRNAGRLTTTAGRARSSSCACRP